MKKAHLYAALTMIFLFFVWWFLGGTIWGAYLRPSPAERTLAFIFENFQVGLATIFEAFGNILSR